MGAGPAWFSRRGFAPPKRNDRSIVAFVSGEPLSIELPLDAHSEIRLPAAH
jgi:hypothetical protein